MLNNQQQTAPYAIASLVLGISSIVFGCFFVGLVLGIVGAALASKGQKAIQANPSDYSGTGMLSAGKITSIIGIIFGGIYAIYSIIAVAILGTASLAWWDLFGDLL